MNAFVFEMLAIASYFQCRHHRSQKAVGVLEPNGKLAAMEVLYLISFNYAARVVKLPQMHFVRSTHDMA